MDLTVKEKEAANKVNMDLKELAVLIAIGVTGLIAAICFVIVRYKNKKISVK